MAAKLIFKLLSNLIRLPNLLPLENQRLNVNEIGQLLGFELAVISRQLAVPRRYQLVNTYRRGIQNFYYLDETHILAVVNEMVAMWIM